MRLVACVCVGGLSARGVGGGAGDPILDQSQTVGGSGSSLRAKNEQTVTAGMAGTLDSFNDVYPRTYTLSYWVSLGTPGVSTPLFTGTATGPSSSGCCTRRLLCVHRCLGWRHIHNGVGVDGGAGSQFHPEEPATRA